ncbi:MAG: hypothetical protein RR273_06290, partial [Oscillospiraceae bacterium]
MWEKDDLFFKELEKCIGEFYVINEETQSIIYMSKGMSRKTPSLCEKCYTALHGRKTRCPFCPETLETSETKLVDGHVC